MTEPKRAIKNIASRTIYAPYFRQRWQNMQNIVNDSAFMSLVPEPYLSYYQAYIRQWLQWSTGYVPMLHRGDFFATGMGYTVCDLFARECMSGGYRIDSPNERLKAFLTAWGENDLDDVFSKMFFFANAGGNAILALTPIDGELYPSVIPINRMFFQIGRHGEITEATIFNRFTAGETAYYAREHRVMLAGHPYYRVSLAKGTLVVSPSWNADGLSEVPAEIEGQWRYAYGGIRPGVWYALPAGFRTTGLYNVRNKAVAVALADMPGYSDSTLHTALDVLYSIDYNYTQQQLDQYWGRTRVLLPDQMKNVSVNAGMQAQAQVDNGVSFLEAMRTGAPLEDEVYAMIPSRSIDGEPMKPFFLQPDLRGEAHKYIRDADLELLASKVGISSSDLANHLTYNNAKTATEVRAEESTTEISVGRKRKLASRAIDAMLQDAARFYGFDAAVEINWGRTGGNTAEQNRELLADYQAGTLPLREYLKRRWPDLGEEEIAVWLEEIREGERNALGGGAFDPADYYGEGGNAGGQEAEPAGAGS